MNASIVVPVFRNAPGRRFILKIDADKNSPNALRVPEMRLDLKLYPDPILRRTCEPVEKFDSEIQDIANQMFLMMHRYGGIGLAAPQAGLVIRLFIYNKEHC